MSELNDPTDASSWLARIQEALVNQAEAEPGPAGETPVGRLIEEIIKALPDGRKAAAITTALAGVLTQANNRPPDYWIWLSILLSNVEPPDKQEILSALKARLDSLRDLDDPHARAWLLVSFAKMNGVLTSADLEREDAAKRGSPWLWADAAVMEGHLQLAAEHVKQLLRNRIDATALKRRLSSWSRQWASQGLDFKAVLQEWLDAAPNDAKRGLRIAARHKGLLRIMEKKEIMFLRGALSRGTTFDPQVLLAAE